MLESGGKNGFFFLRNLKRNLEVSVISPSWSTCPKLNQTLWPEQWDVISSQAKITNAIHPTPPGTWQEVNIIWGPWTESGREMTPKCDFCVLFAKERKVTNQECSQKMNSLHWHEGWALEKCYIVFYCSSLYSFLPRPQAHLYFPSYLWGLCTTRIP